MTRRQSYGESMAAWERANDEWYWTKSLQKALDSHDYILIEELIAEGIAEDYSFPSIKDPIACQLMDKYKLIEKYKR